MVGVVVLLLGRNDELVKLGGIALPGVSDCSALNFGPPSHRQGYCRRLIGSRTTMSHSRKPVEFRDNTD